MKHRIHHHAKQIASRMPLRVIAGVMLGVLGVGSLLLFFISIFAPSSLPFRPMPEKTQQQMDRELGLSAGWGCPFEAWLHCSPEDTDVKKECDPAFIGWVRRNCPGFQGVVAPAPSATSSAQKLR